MIDWYENEMLRKKIEHLASSASQYLGIIYNSMNSLDFAAECEFDCSLTPYFKFSYYDKYSFNI